MNTYDVRTNKDEPITSIKFKDHDLKNGSYEAISIKNFGEYVDFGDNAGDPVNLNASLFSKEDVNNLILALQKALELGWFK